MSCIRRVISKRWDDIVYISLSSIARIAEEVDLTTRYHVRIITDKSNESQDASLRVEMGNPESSKGTILINRIAL